MRYDLEITTIEPTTVDDPVRLRTARRQIEILHQSPDLQEVSIPGYAEHALVLFPEPGDVAFLLVNPAPEEQRAARREINEFRNMTTDERNRYRFETHRNFDIVYLTNDTPDARDNARKDMFMREPDVFTVYGWMTLVETRDPSAPTPRKVIN